MCSDSTFTKLLTGWQNSSVYTSAAVFPGRGPGVSLRTSNIQHLQPAHVCTQRKEIAKFLSILKFNPLNEQQNAVAKATTTAERRGKKV